MEIKFWQPFEVADLLLILIIQKENIDLVSLAKLSEDELRLKAEEIFKAFEGYANGGLEFIKSRFEDRPEDFRNNYWYMKLLDEVIPKEKTDNIVNKHGSSDEAIT